MSYPRLGGWGAGGGAFASVAREARRFERTTATRLPPRAAPPTRAEGARDKPTRYAFRCLSKKATHRFQASSEASFL